MASWIQEIRNRILSLICQSWLKKMFDYFTNSLTAIEVCNKNFNFSHNQDLGLTKKKFHQLMDEHKVPKNKQISSRGYLELPGEKGGFITKTIILYVKSKTKNPKYDVLVAEWSSSTGFNWRGIVVYVVGSILACVVLYLVNTPLSIIIAVALIFVIIFLVTASKQSNPVRVEEMSTRFMIRQLIDTECLIERGRELVFVHGRNHTTFGGLVNIEETERTLPQYHPAGNFFKTEPVGFT